MNAIVVYLIEAFGHHMIVYWSMMYRTPVGRRNSLRSVADDRIVAFRAVWLSRAQPFVVNTA